MKIVIMGCGRVGARLALLFEADGHTVSVIDVQAQAFTRLGGGFRGTTKVGTAIDEDVLRAVGIAEADLFLAVTNRDNSNIMAAQIARQIFQVPRVITRIYDPDREETFHRLGMETLCPTTLMSNRFYEAIQNRGAVHEPRLAGPDRPGPAALADGEGAAVQRLPRPDHDAHEDAPEGSGAHTPPGPDPDATGHEERPSGHLAQALRDRFRR